MADESNDGEANEDSWLYGNSDPKPPGPDIRNEEAQEKEHDETDGTNQNEKKKPADPEGDFENDPNVDDPTRAADEMEEQEPDENVNGENGDMDSDDSDDDINVVIGDIKSGPNYNIKVSY